MKKQILSTVLCIIMVLTIIPVFATTTTAPTTCNVLFEEDFEDGNKITMSTSNTVTTGAVQTLTDADAYGQGTKNYAVSNANTSNYATLVFNTSAVLTKSMLGGVHTESADTYGYTVELSADWNPFDGDYSSPVSRLGIRGAKTDGTVGNCFMELKYTGGEQSTCGRTIEVLNRSSESVETVDLSTVIGDEVWDAEHVYRIRFVMKPYTAMQTIDSVKYAGTIDIYVDGVNIYTFEYQHNAKEAIVYGLFCRTNKTDSVALDNIQMVEYWDALTADTSSYINDDALVSAIRRCEYELDELSEDKQTALAAAIATAKTAYEDANRTQATVDAATVALEAAEEDAYKVYQYQTLYQEDFEGSEPTPFYAYTDATYNESQVAMVGSTDDAYYALDDQWYQLDVTADEKAGLVHEFATPSSGIGQKGDNLDNNIANHYKTELSFDYKMPKDFTTYILINAISAEHDYTFLKSGKIFQMNMNPTTGVATLFDRNAEMGTINLADYATGASFVEEVNRFRFVFAPNTMEEIDGVKYAGTVTLYINGVQAFEGKYKYNDRESAIGGMTVKCATGDAGKPLGYIDNIELIDYDDTTLAVENSVPYVNRDRLVAAVRGGWSAYVSGENSSSVTVKAIDAINAGKAIVACYNANGMVAASMVDVTNLLADATQAIPIPSGWSGDVRVFLWDAGRNALMNCVKMTIE